MLKPSRGYVLVLLGFVMGVPLLAQAEDDGSASCLQEIERVCVHMEDHIETCLAERGSQLTPSCRELMKSAMTLMQDRSGPAPCVADIQRLCPDLKSNALTRCVTDKQSQFSDACQKYLQAASQKQPEGLQ